VSASTAVDIATGYVTGIGVQRRFVVIKVGSGRIRVGIGWNRKASIRDY